VRQPTPILAHAPYGCGCRHPVLLSALDEVDLSKWPSRGMFQVYVVAASRSGTLLRPLPFRYGRHRSRTLESDAARRRCSTLLRRRISLVGNALGLHLGRSWRDHSDTDIGIVRSEAPRLLEVFDGWDIWVAAAGVLTPWAGEPLEAESSQNNLWCRSAPTDPWCIDVTISGGNDREWIYRRDPSVRRPWSDAVLITANGIPYLAPELQLLFKSKDIRPKDDLDADAVIPSLEPKRRSWLATHLPVDHPWQTTISEKRARLLLGAVAGPDADVRMLAAGRSSQAWLVTADSRRSIARIPIPNSGRQTSYRSEQLIGERLAEAGHPVCRWRTGIADDVECSIGPVLDGEPVEYEVDWASEFITDLAALLRDLHRLTATGWGPLENSSSVLRGVSASATDGIVDRWFHALMWPFDGSDIESHPIASLESDLVSRLARMRDSIFAASRAPFGVVHSDLHRQHLLNSDGRLSGVLDFGDAFVGSTAWDFALLRWYYGAANTDRVVEACEPGQDLSRRGSRLAVAVGCYKVAKTPSDKAARARLRSLLAG